MCVHACMYIERSKDNLGYYSSWASYLIFEDKVSLTRTGGSLTQPGCWIHLPLPPTTRIRSAHLIWLVTLPTELSCSPLTLWLNYAFTSMIVNWNIEICVPLWSPSLLNRAFSLSPSVTLLKQLSLNFSHLKVQRSSLNTFENVQETKGLHEWMSKWTHACMHGWIF